MIATPSRRPNTRLNAARKRKMVTFTLSPEAILRLESLRLALDRPASTIVEDLIMGRRLSGTSVAKAKPPPTRKR